ncbi:MAG: discoidin domain-containing protein [Candidatus Bathyarchaeia archaeon]
MTSYTVEIEGKQYYPVNIFFSKNVDFRTPNDFELVFADVESGINLDNTVDIKRDGTTIFRGKVETVETYKTGDNVEFRVSGRDISVKLLRLITGRDIYQSKDPGEICGTLNSPGILIQLQPQKFIVYPEIDTFIENVPDRGDPTNTVVAAKWYRHPTLPWLDNVWRGLIKFNLDNIFARIASVTSAILYYKVKVTYNYNLGFTPYYNPRIKAWYRVLGPWDASVKWTTQPSFATSYTASSNHYHEETEVWHNVDLTSDVQAWKSGSATNYGWMFRDPSDDIANGNRYETLFYSSEASDKPYLILTVTYSDGIVATASASLNNSNAFKIIDQNTSTKWGSGTSQASGQWVKVDMGKTYSLRRIIIQMGIPNYARNFMIEVSTDDVNYTQVYSKTNNDASTIDVTLTPVNARYVKMTLTGSASDQWDIYEMYFYESTEPALEIGEIEEFGKEIDFRVDYEYRLDAIARLAESVNWEAWVGLDDKLYFKPQMGSPKVDVVRFKENLDLFSARKQVSMLHQAKSVTVLGHGEGAEQLRVTKRETGYSSPERVFEAKDLISLDALNYVADFLLDQFKDPVATWEAEVKDHYDTLAWACGDTIRIIDEDGNTYDLRVLREDRNFNMEEGETVKMILGNKLVCLPNILQEMLDNIDIWAHVDQSIIARGASE